ncbi:peptidase C45, acyl-coenzyme A:6-aminopenicillanic acid acyl-transferase [Methanocorpusculum labreanum Z]|uniref:Peptidase C45, acyl-coenzyme A:6-aminopenicillanic acid acyl-transferase n=1 Tax=Methanocorpusculum labreanum (strain ATCC 43576 / DSM 4855 / Z) TaxID=410358 RepID=A2ST34_METLZ|nr:C45 family peptidase [Methanocorpusculum labreanum]ABN07490.1 peptidase C45, acyl-coenzyme A:6-aminopenicillanic acid acyl-transferase [Methanocorpusculum labreanum Z]
MILLEGSYREMGRQYGGLMKTELLSEYAMLTKTLEDRGYSLDYLRWYASAGTQFQPERMKEITRGMAETTGLSEADLSILYYGPALYISMPAGCSYLAVWDTYTTDGSVVLSRNWDLPDLLDPFNPYYVLAVCRPTDGSNGVATFGPAGSRPETLMNSAGLFIADDNSGLAPVGQDDRPDLISEFFRLMLDYSDLDGLKTGVLTTRPDVAWIVDVGGPDGAYVFEVGLNETKVRIGDGVVAAANHFVDPSWDLTTPPGEHSLTRYANLLSQAEAAKGSIDAEEMMQIRDVLMTDDGATFRHSELFGYPYSSNHQVVFVPATRTLWMKVIDLDWQKVELAPLFAM